MKVFKVYNVTTEHWLDWPLRCFSDWSSVYATAFTYEEDAEEAAAVMTAWRYHGHNVKVIALETADSTEAEWTAEDEESARAAADWDAEVAEREAAVGRQIEAEENERTEREDSYA